MATLNVINWMNIACQYNYLTKSNLFRIVSTICDIHAIWVALQNTTMNFKITNEWMKWQNLSPPSKSHGE